MRESETVQIKRTCRIVCLRNCDTDVVACIVIVIRKLADEPSIRNLVPQNNRVAAIVCTAEVVQATEETIESQRSFEKRAGLVIHGKFHVRRLYDLFWADGQIRVGRIGAVENNAVEATARCCRQRCARGCLQSGIRHARLSGRYKGRTVQKRHFSHLAYISRGEGQRSNLRGNNMCA